MAIQQMVRFKPDMFREAMQSLVQWSDPATGTGTVVLPVQVIAFNDTDIPNIGQAIPGDPAIEKFITILDEDVIQVDLATVGGMTAANAQTWLQNAAVQWAETRKPSLQALQRVLRQARRMNPQAIL